MSDEVRVALVEALRTEAVRAAAGTAPRRPQLWRPTKPVGLRGFAVLLTKDRGGTRLDIVATREQPALMARVRERMVQGRQENPHMVTDNNRRQRDRSRRAKSEMRKRLARSAESADGGKI